MNINKLGNQAGINPSTIRSIMKKRCDSPKAETVHYICIGFGISLKEFYDSDLFENIIDDD
ncbi:MAG: helix-turn-helix transcriptional regulator [Clostridia bacterium]|nr:helix-turn-helix transcriptional regulator [Clostridia bacterium]